VSGPDVDSELARLEALAEGYAAMIYESPTPTRATGYYSDMKDAFIDAIGHAERAGRADHAARLERRLDALKTRYRDQFTGHAQRPTLGRVGPATQWREAQAAENRGEVDRAIVIYQALLDVDDGPQELGDIRASAGLALARLLLDGGDGTGAAEALRRVLAVRGVPPALADAARRALAELKDY